MKVRVPEHVLLAKARILRLGIGFALHAVMVLLVAESVVAQARPDAQSDYSAVDELFKKWGKTDSPGAAIAIVGEGRLKYCKGYGCANLEYGVPITSETVFHAASLSKQITAFAILLLESDGKLALDDDIREYIPQLPDYGKKVSLRHLANHSSGIRDQWRLLSMAGWRMDDVITQEQVMRMITRQRGLNFNPGERNLYSNSGYTLLAEVVAKVSGKTFEEFTKDRIFSPLKMMNTTFNRRNETIIPNRAYSYERKDGILQKCPLNFSTVGPTSLLTTAEDFSKWAMNFQKPVVGSADLIARLNENTTLNNGRETGFALGQMQGTYKGVEVFVHSGSDAGFRAYFVRVPKHDAAVVVLSNFAEMNPIEQAIGALELELPGVFQTNKSSQSEKSVFEHSPDKFVKLDNDRLGSFVGKYWEPSERYTREIFLKDSRLFYRRSESSETELAPISENEFKMIGDTEDVSVVFETNKDAEQVMRLNINKQKPIIFWKYSPVELSEYEGSFYSPELDSRYQLAVKGKQLFATHLRAGDIRLKPIKENVFTSSNRSFPKLIFERNENNVVTGFTASGERVTNLKFTKLSH